MEKIPIKFEYECKIYEATFEPVPGAGQADTLNLMINRYYQGTLMYTTEWVFHTPTGRFAGMGQYFGEYVTAWVG